ncbi:MAG: hypothetical protein OXF01_10935 [Gemmatimonadetes bacterium]|nr:hypothetical protein [Gemmatimonadota bacterium]
MPVRAGGGRSIRSGTAFNHEHGWGRPDDPTRARVEQPGHRAYVEAAELRAGLRLESSPRDLIRDYLDLTERLRRRPEHGRREIEELTASGLARPAGNSRRAVRNALRTERDTEVAVGRMRALVLKAWPTAAVRDHRVPSLRGDAEQPGGQPLGERVPLPPRSGARHPSGTEGGLRTVGEHRPLNPDADAAPVQRNRFSERLILLENAPTLDSGG